jgi:DNA-binding SARP family transcriptional activator
VVGVTVDGLSEAIWGEHVPASAAKVVQGCIVRLRRALGTGAIERSSGGYRLVLHRDEADHLHFEDLVSRGRSMLESGQPDRTLHQIEEALGLW